MTIYVAIAARATSVWMNGPTLIWACMLLRAPVIEDAMNNHPLWFNAVAVEALLHHGILGVDGLPLLSVKLIFTRTIVVRRGFIHVIFTLVVPIHDGVIKLQLWVHGNRIFPLKRFNLPEGFSNKTVLEYTSFCNEVLYKKWIQNNYKIIKHNSTIHWLKKCVHSTTDRE